MQTVEQCLAMGPGDGKAALPTIILVPPLFDEANRMRRTLALTMRALAARGHHALLPDLPGQNDSLLPTTDATLSLWKDALARIVAAQTAHVIIASWRGGALIDHGADGACGHWRMAPLTGASIVKTMLRVRVASEKEAGRPTTADALRTHAEHAGMIELAGNTLSSAMVADLEQAQPQPVAPLRTVTPADIGGSALWLRAEPGEDAAMADAMAADISAWSITCAAG
ncbi:MAG: hypothetical protein MUF41_06410 [Sphingopyxis sp.]|nr:hypothetical protein [Sphingopyxis sp.]